VGAIAAARGRPPLIEAVAQSPRFRLARAIVTTLRQHSATGVVLRHVLSRLCDAASNRDQADAHS
jgi:hypothetical protein